MKIPGKTIEKKMSNLEIVLDRMAKRMSKKIIGIIPPSIISQFVENPLNGSIFEFVSPVKGIIKGLTIAANETTLIDWEASIRVFNADLSARKSESLVSSTGVLTSSIDMLVEQGSLVKVIVTPASALKYVSTTLVFVIDRRYVDSDQFVINAINNVPDLLEGIEDGEE